MIVKCNASFLRWLSLVKMRTVKFDYIVTLDRLAQTAAEDADTAAALIAHIKALAATEKTLEILDAEDGTGLAIFSRIKLSYRHQAHEQDGGFVAWDPEKVAFSARDLVSFIGFAVKKGDYDTARCALMLTKQQKVQDQLARTARLDAGDVGKALRQLRQARDDRLLTILRIMI